MEGLNHCGHSKDMERLKYEGLMHGIDWSDDVLMLTHSCSITLAWVSLLSHWFDPSRKWEWSM